MVFIIINNFLVELFNDEEMVDRIMKSSEPREQKALGRQVRNFDQVIWKEKCREIVKRGNKAKVNTGCYGNTCNVYKDN